MILIMQNDTKTKACRVCGCTDINCKQCIEKTGEPCYWIEPNLCSACHLPTAKSIEQDLASFNAMLRRSNLKVFIDDQAAADHRGDGRISARPFIEAIRTGIKKNAVLEVTIGNHKWKPGTHI